MDLSKKALYNSLRFNFEENGALKVEPWQVEKLTEASNEELFSRLKKRGILWDKTEFVHLAEDFDGPEEFAESLSSELSPKEADQLYLILFELWRRFLSERKSVTIFADDLDAEIALYDREEIKDFSRLQYLLQNLLILFQDSEESGLAPQEFMKSFSKLFAHDLEEFLYDFLFDEIEENHANFVSDFLDVMIPFVQDRRWFDLLRLRAAPPSEGEEFHQAIREFLKKQKPLDLGFLLEIAAFLAKRGDKVTYGLVAKKILPLLELEEDFLDFLDLSSDFFRLNDEEEKEALLQKLLLSRNKGVDAPLSSQDPDLKRLEQLLL